MAKKTDEKTLELMNEVARRKKEIEKVEKPNWITNCSFAYIEGSSQIINIHVEANVRNLICIASFLLEKERAYREAAAQLEVVDPPAFLWCGHAVKDWVEDIKMRIAKIQISTKKKKLEMLEARLNTIISPELRAEMELEQIQKDLDK